MIDSNVYKLIELTGTSTKSMEDAVQNALKRAARTVRHMRWFAVTEIRGAIDTDAVRQWQVTLKVGFSIDEPAPAKKRAKS